MNDKQPNTHKTILPLLRRAATVESDDVSNDFYRGGVFICEVTELGASEEVQSVTVSATGGTYTLTYDSEETDPIAFDALAADVQAALEALSTIGAGNVLVTGGPGDEAGSDPYLVAFTGDLANTDIDALVADDSLLTTPGGSVAVATTVPGVAATTNEQQSVTISGSPTGGTFTLTFDGETTDPIAFDAAAQDVEDALAALSNVGVGQVDVSGSAGGPWTVEFIGTLAQTDVVEMTADDSGLTVQGDATVAEETAGGAALTPSVTFKVQGKNQEAGTYYDILTAAAVTAVGQKVLKIYPGITAAANLSASDILPAVFRVVATHGDADDVVYSVGVDLIR